MVAFTTADASERLAKRQAAKQLGVSAGIGSGVKVKTKKPGILGSALQGLGTVYDFAKNQPGTQSANPINTGAGVSMGTIANPIQSTVEPTRLALRRAVGDITAIPGVGQPSASPTATDIRSGNWAAPAVDYAGLAIELLPGSVPAYKEAKRSLSTAVARTVPDLPIPKPEPIPSYVPGAKYDAAELARELARNRTVRFRPDRFPTEMSNASRYFGPEYHDIQSYLRMLDDNFKNENEILQVIANLDSLFQNAPRLKKPATFYRGVKPSFYDPDYIDYLMSHKIGDVITDEGFLSTTFNPTIADYFRGSYGSTNLDGIRMAIEVPEGMQFISPQHTLPTYSRTKLNQYGNPMPNLGIESEFLFPRNYSLEVLTNPHNNEFTTRLLPYR